MEFMILIYADEQVYERMSEAQIADVMAAYGVYESEMRVAGVMRHGAELASVRKARTVRVRKGEPAITDGPFAETKDCLGGYFLIDCADMDEAVKWASRCPSAVDGSIEVRPILSGA